MPIPGGGPIILSQLNGGAPAAHAASHVTGGADKIRDATAAQDGIATAAQITKLDALQTDALKIHLVGTSAAWKTALQFIIDNPLVQFHIIKVTASFTFVAGDNPTGTVTTPFHIEPDFVDVVIPHKITWANGTKVLLDTNVVIDAVDMDYGSGVGDNRWRYADKDQGSFIHKNLTIDYGGGKSALHNQFDGHCRFEFHNCKIISTSSNAPLCETEQNAASVEEGFTDVVFVGCDVKGRICRADSDKELMDVMVISSKVTDNGNGIWDVGSAAPPGIMNVRVGVGSKVDTSSTSIVGSVSPTFTRDDDGVIDRWITLLEPDKIQLVIDNVPMFSVESDKYPNGITITKVFLKTDANSTLAINVERWTSPLDGAPTTIVNIATAASAEAASGTLSFAMAAGEILMLDLDTTDVNWAQVGVSFTPQKE